MKSGTGKTTAKIYQTRDLPLAVSKLWPDQGPTPGNVGVCLSGGGSRAMVAAMGQLRGLAQLQVNGAPLLSQVKAISSVSGGAWAAVPFTYAPPDITDETLLGGYVADPGTLVLKTRRFCWSRRARKPEALDYLHNLNLGRIVSRSRFSIQSLIVHSLLIHVLHDVPGRELWQALMAEHILEPYGLYKPAGEQHLPSTAFTLNAETRDEAVAAGVAEEDVFVSDPGVAGRMRRPFLICNAAMLADSPDEVRHPLVPVQSTPLFTGIVGEPAGVHARGRSVGGGAVSSFAFNSRLHGVHQDEVHVHVLRPWSLADAMGTSSSTFAELLDNGYRKLRDDPTGTKDSVVKQLQEFEDGKRIPALSRSRLFDRDNTPGPLLRAAQKLSRLVPEYTYWSPGTPTPDPELGRSDFADGGALDNTAVCAMLAYRDIDSIIAFVNSQDPLAPTELGVVDENGVEIADSRYHIYEQVPPLFGYQPYDPKLGYRLYRGDPDPHRPQYEHNQVFESSAFPLLLQRLWQAQGRERRDRPAVATMQLRVLENRWHGVPGRGGPGDELRERMTVVWNYLGRVRSWHAQLPAKVQRFLGDFDDLESGDNFPNFSTAKTHFDSEYVNLLAHLTAWAVADKAHREAYLNLFVQAPSAAS